MKLEVVTCSSCDSEDGVCGHSGKCHECETERCWECEPMTMREEEWLTSPERDYRYEE